MPKKDTSPADTPTEPFWLSIDPGDSHVGVACWVGETCQWAREYSPGELVHSMWVWLGFKGKATPKMERVVLEQFRLRQKAALQQSGSLLHTPRLIGKIELITAYAAAGPVPILWQEPSQAKMLQNSDVGKARDWVSYGYGGHAKDAEAHGWFWLRKQQRQRDGWE